MGKNDVAIKNWLSDKDRFADFCNGVLFRGERVVKPEELEEAKGESDLLLTDQNKKIKTITRYRDIVMRWQGSVDLVILACESQDSVHYAMSVRNMLYDSLSYTEQIEALWKINKGGESAEQRDKKMDAAEFLSHFSKDDVIYPVITFVFYYDTKPWDGSLDLYSMFPKVLMKKNRELMEKYVPNHWINLVDVTRIENVEQFQSDLGVIFQMLQYQEDKEQLKQFVQQRKDYFSCVDIDTYNVIKIILKAENWIDSLQDDQKGERNMCKALEDIFADGVNQGMEKGIEKGESCLSRLNLVLLKEKRYDDLEKISRDRTYREQMYRQYGIA